MCFDVDIESLILILTLVSLNSILIMSVYHVTLT